ncbi:MULTISPECIES: hypothetical protein [unclassified Arthrobacter]|uniref:hypothetical protein n=1 Tax=unclassified Arthrobacter TaxID=235627 RepID=UPI0021057C93|nr:MULTISPECIES: hypothetical protein [unclassified Arthrobacter]MCQ1987448.1 hypothetical protein [Arthrobacter sp. zg-Y844]MCQ1996792.1 hypothetical protein [Arthrobacter sp. zg-Y1171]UWX82386.1 hypothetical protein N2L00_02830 [Arthrobacter sp. zg-Y1171]
MPEHPLPGPVRNLPWLPGPGNVLHPLPAPLPEANPGGHIAEPAPYYPGNPGGNILHPLPAPLPEAIPGGHIAEPAPYYPGDPGRGAMWPGIDPGFWADPSRPGFERLPVELPQEITKMPDVIHAEPWMPEVIPFEPRPDVIHAEPWMPEVIHFEPMPMPEIIDIKPMPLPEVIHFEPMPDTAPGDFGGAGVTPEPTPVPREINGIPVVDAILLADQAPSDAEPNKTRGRWGLT